MFFFFSKKKTEYEFGPAFPPDPLSDPGPAGPNPRARGSRCGEWGPSQWRAPLRAQALSPTPATVEHTTGRHDIVGGQVNPWGFENIANKFRVNAGMVLDSSDVDAAVNAWSDIPQMTDVSGEIRRTLVKA